MTMPNLKRVKISSDQQLRNWLTKNADHPYDVMIVSCNKTSRDKYISRDQVRVAVHDCGWAAGRSYTLDGNLVGHVVSPA